MSIDDANIVYLIQRVSDTLSTSLKDFKAPFIVQHGLSDVVTDPSLSQALYDESPSKDKTIKLYEGVYLNETIESSQHT